jgi:hypothetical protein
MRALLAFVFVVSAGAVLAQESPVYASWPFAPKAGEVFVWGLQVKFQAMGQDASFSGKLQRRTLSVDESGGAEMESRLLDGKVTVMGSEMEQTSEPSVYKLDKAGRTLDPSQPGSELEELLKAFLSVSLPQKGAKMGDSWSLDVPGLKGKGEAKLVEATELEGKKSLRLSVEYKCASGSGSGAGSVHLSAEDGTLLNVDAKFAKVQPGPGIRSDGTVSVKLLERKAG